MLSDLSKLTEFGSGRAEVQVAVKEHVSRVATWVCKNLNVTHQENPFLLALEVPEQPTSKIKQNKNTSP